MVVEPDDARSLLGSYEVHHNDIGSFYKLAVLQKFLKYFLKCHRLFLDG
jgi:hypothetical protein